MGGARIELRRGDRVVPLTLTRVEPGHALQVVEAWIAPYPVSFAVNVATEYPFLLAALVVLMLRRRVPLDAAPALPDVTCVGPYRLEGLLGRGGMAEVYRASGTEGVVALKVLFEEFSADEEFRQRFEREVDICSRHLKHPNIVSVYGMGSQGERLYMAMEYVEGKPLAGPIEGADAVRVGMGLCEGLQHAHGAGVIHRDLKPDNVLIAVDGTPRIADFGLARGRHYPTITVAGSAVGTPAYMAPEQARGGVADARSDIYALGAVLYEAVSGRAAFPGETEVERLARQIEGDPAPLDGPLGALVARMLARDPAGRPSGMDEVDGELRRI